ncbi:MAG: dihydroorotate dehydrogenase electron transfer subunit [Nitrospirota bacterium]
MSRHFKAKITNNLSLNGKNGLLSIEPLEPVINPEPGQFYMIGVSNSHDPFLKRPFSFFRKTSEGIQFLYEVRGKGTMMMKGFRDGEVINILGPLGKGYPEPGGDKTPLLIAGGMGIASVFSLVEAFAKRAYVFYGAKDKEGLLMLDGLEELAGELIISTDDGSFGEKGTIVDVLNNFLTSHFSLLTSHLIYACGPKPMLEAVSRIALGRGIKGYISAEENMACGVGACLGCAIKVKSQKSKVKSQIYKMVCKDGPVFPIEEIVW